MNATTKMQRDTFQSPYEQYKDAIGMTFENLGEVRSSKEDEEIGRLYKIKLADGREIEAWEEEVYTGVGWDPKCGPIGH